MLVTLMQKDNEVHIRISIGPEGEAVMDLHGAQDLDITELVEKLEGYRAKGYKVLLHVIRTRDEAESIEDARALGILHSFVTMTFPDSKPQALVPENKVAAAAETPAPARPVATAKKRRWQRCAYCGQEEELLPVPGFMICKTCAQIELGRMREREQKQQAKTPPASETKGEVSL